jgi:hypothetical protein
MNPKHLNNNQKTPCMKCMKFTESIRLGRANYECKECKNDKSLSDVFYYECMNREEKTGGLAG